MAVRSRSRTRDALEAAARAKAIAVTFWMTPTMTLAHLVFSIATALYILSAIRFEERDRAMAHGAIYEQYSHRVPNLLFPQTSMIGTGLVGDES